MSSVSGSGGSNRQDEVIRRAREEHQTKESELVKRHNKEIRRLNESHQAELDRINANHSQQMDELRKASQKQMSVQTMRHQRDAEDMRRLYQQQAQKSAYENERKMDALRESIGKDKETTVQNQNDRLEAVNEHYREVLTGKDQAHEKSLREMRDSQQEAIARNRESLEAAHKKELDALETDRRERFGDLQKRYNNLQASTTQRLKQQEVQHLSDKQRMSDNLIETVSRERRAFDDTLQVQREGFQDSLRKQADSHEQRYAKEREAIANTRENLKADLGSRIGNQIRGLERQVADLKAVNVRKELEVKRKAKQEVENIRTSYQKNIDSYEDQKRRQWIFTMSATPKT